MRAKEITTITFRCMSSQCGATIAISDDDARLEEARNLGCMMCVCGMPMEAKKVEVLPAPKAKAKKGAKRGKGKK